MTDVNNVTVVAAGNLSQKLCGSCNRPTKADIKCTVCNTCYHAACSVRIPGMKIVGFNQLECVHCLGDKEDPTTDSEAEGT